MSKKELTEKDLELLLNNTHLNREQLIDWHQKFLTEYPNGFRNKSQFLNIYKNLYKEGNPEKFAKFAFAAFDIDHNGKVTFDEFIICSSFLLNQDSNTEHENYRLALAFDIFDINHNGKVEKSELKKLYNAIYELKGQDHKKADERVAEILKMYDTDKSGSLNKDEFKLALLDDDIFSILR